MTRENQLPILELRKECADETILINSRKQKAPNATSSKKQCSIASVFHNMGRRKKMAFWSHIALIGDRLHFANLSVHWHQIQSIILFHFWPAIRKFYMPPSIVQYIAGLWSPKISVSFIFKCYSPVHVFSGKKDMGIWVVSSFSRLRVRDSYVY